MTLTNEVLKNYVTCHYKLVQLHDKEVPSKGRKYQNEYLSRKRFLHFVSKNKIQLKKLNLENGKSIEYRQLTGFYQIYLIDKHFQLTFPLIEFFSSKLGDKQIKAYFFSSEDRVSKIEKEYGRLMTSIIARKLKIKCTIYSLIYNYESKVKNFKSLDLDIDISKDIKTLVEKKDVEPTRITHCIECEFI